MNFVDETSPNPMWDVDQLKIINSYGGARMMVEAGSGTGKTAVVRAHLVDLVNEEHIEPGNTRMISFTRTAVAEICDRSSPPRRHLSAASIR